MKAAESGIVRLITPYHEGDHAGDRTEVIRFEGLARCRQCRRLHPYRVGQFNPLATRRPAEDEVVDSWEDAAHLVRKWLPLAPRYLGARGRLADEPTEQFFDTRAAAIAWLLEAVPDA
jgi:hypothetical protein